MGQPVAFFEIITPDAERARKFYTEMFGWTAEADPNMGGYALVDTNAGEGAIGGGIGPASAPGEGPSVKVYMRVDDLDACLDRAERLGGKRLVPPTDLPEGYGRIAVFADPDGNQVGLWA
jgi:predicted enzyme related to lactoylglutathione lyase